MELRSYEWMSFTKDSFGALGQVQYLKFTFEKGGKIGVTGSDTEDWGVVLNEIKIVGLQEYSDEAGVIIAHAYSRPERMTQYGDKVYILEPDNLLYTLPQVQRRADDILREVEKSKASYDVNVVYGPHLSLGETVLLQRPRINRNFICYVEKISDSQKGITPSVNLNLANYYW